jgi:hypothetical protein
VALQASAEIDKDIEVDEDEMNMEELATKKKRSR